MFKADLHCHTTCSDGTFSPEELLLHAQKIGLSGLSITDHDTIDAYAVAIPLAKELGLVLGSGAEFSCLFQDMSVHVLGYDFDLKSPAIAALCQRHALRRLERNRVILEKLKRMNKPIEEEELLKMGKNIGRPHIAHLMVEKKYVATIQQAFSLYIGDEQPCFYRGAVCSVEETLEILHSARGKAFLAHPHLLRSNRKIRELLKLPFDGIECYYAKFPADQEKRWLKMAQERGLLISGGSDFHGSIKSYLPLGASWVDEQRFQQIFQHPL